MEEYKLSHLKELEAESIHIIREVAAEFENPGCFTVSERIPR
jgi:sulfate adenylyltransferase subunit 2